MALTYPLAFPAIARFREAPSFRLAEALAVNRSGAGEMEAMELADPIWSARWVTPVLSEADRAAWTAWRAALLGGGAFLGYDPFRPYPLNYGAAVLALTRAGGGAFDGTAKLTDFDATSVEISTLPAGYVAIAGDRISLVRPSSQRSLHEIVEGATANGSGVGTFNVMPPVPADVVVDNTAAQLVRPQAVFILNAESFEAPAVVGFAPVSFEGVQTTAPQS